MKKVLFVLCVFLVCLLCVRFALGNNSSISSEAMLTYITNNFKTTESLKEITTDFSEAISGFDKIIKDFDIDNISDKVRDVTNIPQLKGVLEAIALIIDVLYYSVYFSVYGTVFLCTVVANLLPLLISALRDVFSVLQLISYLLFGTAL